MEPQLWLKRLAIRGSLRNNSRSLVRPTLDIRRKLSGESRRENPGRGNGHQQQTWRISLPLAGALTVSLVMGYVVGAHVLPGRPQSCTVTCQQSGRPSSLLSLSPRQFDAKLDKEEESTGLTEIRKQVTQRVTGHVLEVAMGTGRNFGLYQVDGLEERGTVKSLTGIDISSEMLDVAANKVTAMLTSYKVEAAPSVTLLRSPEGQVVGGAAEYLEGKIRLVRGNALDNLPPPPEETGVDGYDTIIQTFGLCSVSDPELLVRNMVQSVKPGSGRILLLEHGRASGLATRTLVNWWLDWYAADHCQKYGCWWNRDIESIVRRVVEDIPGAEVIHITRPPKQLQTVLCIELRLATDQHSDGA